MSEWICKADSDSSLVKQLQSFGLSEEDAYELIDGFDSPQPPAIKGSKVRRINEALLITSISRTYKIQEDTEAKWQLTVKELT